MKKKEISSDEKQRVNSILFPELADKIKTNYDILIVLFSKGIQ